MFEKWTKKEREEAAKVVEESRDGKWAELSSGDAETEPECILCQNEFGTGDIKADICARCVLHLFTGSHCGDTYDTWCDVQVEEGFNSPGAIKAAKAMRKLLDDLAKVLRSKKKKPAYVVEEQTQVWSHNGNFLCTCMTKRTANRLAKLLNEDKDRREEVKNG